MDHTIALITETMEVICVDAKTGEEETKTQLNFSEYRMLAFLIQNEKNISNRAQLLEEGWPGKFVTENSLNVSIMKLRKKIDNLACEMQIKTFLGKGYKLLYPKTEEIAIFETYGDFVKKFEDIDTLESSNSENDVLERSVIGKEIPPTERKVVFFSSKRKFTVAIGCILLTFLLFFTLYFESFKSFTCEDQDVCSFLKRDDI